MELPAGRPWPKGDYRVDIMIGAALAASALFRISDGATAPTAKPPSASSKPVLPVAITIDSVEVLLRELGFQPQRKLRKDGVPYFEVEIDGNKTAFALYGCMPSPCTQSLLHVGFKPKKPVNLSAINDWNRDQRLVRAYLNAEGAPTLESDLVLTGAQVTTIRAWIEKWREGVPRFKAHIAK